MPTFANSTAIRDSAEGFSLALNARHVFVVGEPSKKVTTLKGRAPDNVDVVLGSNLVFTLSGTLDRARLSGSDMQQSAVARHLLHYLKANAIELGLESFSDIYIDEDGIAKFSVTSARPPRTDSRSPAARLLALDLIYAYRSTTGDPGNGTSNGALQDLSPFSSELYLSFATALDRIAHRFASLHLVKRYPLIFGSWRAKLDIECGFYPSISHSIEGVIQRSPNVAFRQKCRKLLETIQTQRFSISSASNASLLGYLQTSAFDDATNDARRMELPTDVVICQTLAHLYRSTIRPAPYKGNLAYSTRSDDDGHEIHLAVEPNLHSELPGGIFSDLSPSDDMCQSSQDLQTFHNLWSDDDAHDDLLIHGSPLRDRITSDLCYSDVPIQLDEDYSSTQSSMESSLSSQSDGLTEDTSSTIVVHLHPLLSTSISECDDPLIYGENRTKFDVDLPSLCSASDISDALDLDFDAHCTKIAFHPFVSDDVSENLDNIDLVSSFSDFTDCGSYTPCGLGSTLSNSLPEIARAEPFLSDEADIATFTEVLDSASDFCLLDDDFDDRDDPPDLCASYDVGTLQTVGPAVRQTQSPIDSVDNLWGENPTAVVQFGKFVGRGTSAGADVYESDEDAFMWD